MTRAYGLQVRDLTIRDAQGCDIVKQATLRAVPGEALVVIGETGSGKSLIAQALLGLLPDGFTASGHICFAGRSPTCLSDRTALRRHWARDIILLPQEPAAALNPTMRVARQLIVAPGQNELARDAALVAVDLSADDANAYPWALSGGMAQRALVACAIGGSAPVIVIDEPTKGLDPPRVRQVIRLLEMLQQAGRALVVITHDPVLVRGLRGSVAVLYDRRIVEHLPIAHLFERPRHAYSRAWLAAEPSSWPDLRRGRHVTEVIAEGHGLGFGFSGKAPLFADVDICIRRGSIVALTGPSGSGKTTLGNILVGLRRPDAGHVLWAGYDPYRDERWLTRMRRRFQKLHQDPAGAFAPHRPIRRQLQDIAGVVPGLDVSAALPPLLNRLQVKSNLLDRYPSEISGGEAQRLAIARLLMLDPIMIIADEPTSRLDPILQKATMLLLRDLVAERAMGLILISHDRAVVRALADTVVTLRPPHRS